MASIKTSKHGAVLVLFALAASALTAPALAQWAWKDDNGRVVYSDRPPPAGVKTDRIVRQPSNAQTVMPSQPGQAAGAASAPAQPAGDARQASSGPRSLAEQEMEFRKRQQERADAERKAQEEQTKSAAKAAECERARGYLRVLEEGGRVARTDSSGNREFLDDAQRASEVDRTKKIVQQACG